MTAQTSHVAKPKLKRAGPGLLFLVPRTAESHCEGHTRRMTRNQQLFAQLIYNHVAWDMSLTLSVPFDDL